MMKNTSIPVIRKMKLLIILPISALIFYSFSEPINIYTETSESKLAKTETSQNVLNKIQNGIIEEGREIPKNTNHSANEKGLTPNKNPKPDQDLLKLNRTNENVRLQQSKEKTIEGKVVQENGKELPGTSIVVANSTTGTVSDKNGEFELKAVPENSEIVFSFVGFKTVKKQPDFNNEMIVVMRRDTVEKRLNLTVRSTKDHKEKGRKPLVFLDGEKIPYESMGEITPESIESIEVLKNETATQKYGQEGKNGVILIKSKKQSSQKPEETIVEITAKENSKNTSESRIPKEKTYNGKPVFFVVEDMPKFPGGDAALQQYLTTNLKYPKEAKEKGIQGRVYVSYIIAPSGKVDDVKVVRGIDPLLDAEARRVIEEMPDWEPGKQRGKNVAVNYTTPINFELGQDVKYH